MPDQISKIQKVRKERDKELKTFHDVMIHFGFNKMDTKGWANKDAICYQHTYYNWFADFHTYSPPLSVWMVGTGLKDGRGFPGGWVYWEPDEIRAELERAIDELGKDPAAGYYENP